ncbi:trigger factor, partial [Mycobacterium sp. 1081908.1]|uniref:trigger factor n=1 Tax=Mycobacterium sp. 1081908.1 TaxID=1834066 RepID=UPI0009ED660C
MKSSVEQLSPTRVRINVEVPFTELEPDFQRAYKELAKQVRLPGFRPGKAPAKLLEARFGREAMLDQVVNDALPARYGQAVAEAEVDPIGQPDIEVTKKEYGEELAFTAEVDVRPKIALPDLGSLKVSVDPIEISDDDVDAELESLRARFGTLKGVERPAALGDFVSIDLSATVDGEEVPNAAAEGLSHEVGSGRLIAGLDDALVGLSVDESKEFTAQLATGEHAGKDAQVGPQLVDGVELAGQLGELVVGLGQFAFLDRPDGDGDLRVLAGVLPGRQLGGEFLGLVDGQ